MSSDLVQTNKTVGKALTIKEALLINLYRKLEWSTFSILLRWDAMKQEIFEALLQ